MGVLLFMVVSGLLTAAAGGRDQELVLFYAVSVFLSFLAGLGAMAVFSHRERRRYCWRSTCWPPPGLPLPCW